MWITMTLERAKFLAKHDKVSPIALCINCNLRGRNGQIFVDKNSQKKKQFT